MVMAPWFGAMTERIPHHILKALVIGQYVKQTTILVNFFETTYLGGLIVKPREPSNKFQDVIKRL